MKAILMSIQPKWCELIASVKKTIEIRKTKPKLDTPSKVYIYCTSSNIHECLMQNENGVTLIKALNYKTAIPVGGQIANGRVIGEFICDDIKTYESEFVDDDCQESITRIDSENEAVFTEWTNDGDCSYDSTDLYKETCVTYDELKKYVGIGFNKFYVWHISDLVIYDKPKELCEFTGLRKTKFGYEPVKITRPPQSWCYVEGVQQ